MCLKCQEKRGDEKIGEGNNERDIWEVLQRLGLVFAFFVF